MGLDYYTSRFLLEAQRSGLNFGRSLTIGRQNFFVTATQLTQLAREFGFDAPAFTSQHSQQQLVYVEPFFTNLLKATSVESLDFSDYEGATYVHDLNQPLPHSLKGKFDTVFEAGSLEHIFNFPTAISNLMEALRPGGTLLMQTPANNYFGHGFYQFSPELFYRVFSPENGFRVQRMHLLEHFFPSHFFSTPLYSVSDPEKVKKRVQLVNNRPTLLLIQATRIEQKELFRSPPQQSDYLPLWTAKEETTAGQPPLCLQQTFKQRIYSLPLKLWGSLLLQYWLNRKNAPALSNRQFYHRIP